MRFHRDIGFPRGYREPTHSGKLIYTAHARHMADERSIVMRNMINFDHVVIIEVGYGYNGRIDHYLARTVYDFDRDITFALTPINDGKYLVKTLWLNDRDDIHTTLDRSKYDIP